MRILAVMLALFGFTVMKTGRVPAAAASGMSRIAFTCRLVDEAGIEASENTKNVNALMRKYNISKERAAKLDSAIGTGLIGKNEWKTVRKKMTLEEAAVMLARADMLINRSSVAEEKVDLIIQKRISDIDEVKTARQREFAAAYALGFLKGKSDGAYSGSRSFEPKKTCSASELKKMIKRLKDEGSRYQLSPDMQMCRISAKDRPRHEELFPYILDSYPNSFYDTAFEFMTKRPVITDEDESSLWKSRACRDYHGCMTWDGVFSKLTYEDRLEAIRKSADRLQEYSRFILPAEYDRYITSDLQGEDITEEELLEEKEADVLIAKQFAMKALNVDYRTIADDTEWQQYMLENGVSSELLESYIDACIKAELIIECDRTEADISAVWVDKTPYTFSNCGRVVRVYAHFRIVSDNGYSEGLFRTGNLALTIDYGQTLRKTKISKDGLTYEFDPDTDWQDGWFDMGLWWNKVRIGIFGRLNYEKVYTADTGFPCEAEHGIPGRRTARGEWKQYFSSFTWDEYVEREGLW